MCKIINVFSVPFGTMNNKNTITKVLNMCECAKKTETANKRVSYLVGFVGYVRCEMLERKYCMRWPGTEAVHTALWTGLASTDVQQSDPRTQTRAHSVKKQHRILHASTIIFLHLSKHTHTQSNMCMAT